MNTGNGASCWFSCVPEDPSCFKVNPLMPGGNKKVTHT